MTAFLAAALIDLGLRSALLLVLAVLAAQTFRGASAEARCWLWAAAIASLALLPFLTLVLPPIAIALPIEAAPQTAVSHHEPAASTAAADAVVLLYALGALALVARMAIGQIALAKLWNQATPVDNEWLALANELATRHALATKVALRVTSECAVPITWGVLESRILLPAAARDWPQQRRSEVLLHELIHAARKDSLVRTWAALVCALYWFNPLVWLAFRHMRIEQELACDDRVVRDGASPVSYARTLLDVASGIAAPRLISNLAAPMAATSDLERRLKWIVRDGPRAVPTRAAKAAAAGLALLAALCAAAADPVRAPAIPPTEAIPPRAATSAVPTIPAVPAVPPVPRVPLVPSIPKVPPVPAVPKIPAVPPTPERVAPQPSAPDAPVQERTRDSP